MKRHLNRFLAMLILLIALSAGVAAQSQAVDSIPDSPGTGVISGRVVTEDGQPLANARVFIGARHDPIRSSHVTTDNEGRFQVTGLDPALYSIIASAPSYVPTSHEPGRIGDSVTLTLIKGGVITGTVTSASGEPLVQIGVRAIPVRDVNRQKYAVTQLERITDDRGVYRLYGLQPGTYLISAGGRGSFSGYASFSGNAYDMDMPIYAPAATRDTAQEINVRSGEERSGVDIRYRAEPGHVISGTVNGPSATSGNYAGCNVTLAQISNGTRQYDFGPGQVFGNRGFSFDGVGDGDYELTALSALGPNELALSEPRRITVKGADVTGLQLVTKLLGSVSGQLVLENSTAPECKGKQQPLFAETLVLVQDNAKGLSRDDPRFISFRQVTPDKAGNVLFSHLRPGQYRLDVQFLAKYWYLKSIVQPAVTAASTIAQSAPAKRQVDAARNWISLKQGERLTGLTLTLAKGAASLRGRIKPAEGERMPAQLYLHLVPSARDNAEDLLRYFATPVNPDGTFALGNLPPGRYWAMARIAEDDEPNWASKLRLPDESQTRTKLRSAAEAAKTEIELRPCQNVTDYHLPLKTPVPSAGKQSAIAP